MVKCDQMKLPAETGEIMKSEAKRRDKTLHIFKLIMLQCDETFVSRLLHFSIVTAASIGHLRLIQPRREAQSHPASSRRREVRLIFLEK